MRRILRIMLCLVMVTSMIGTVAATGEENYIIASTTETATVPALTFTFNRKNGADGIEQITESREFQDFPG